MTRWRTRHRGLRSDRGAAAVEFAIVLVVLLLIIFAIIDFGRLLYVKQAVTSASREGARTAVVKKNWGTTATSDTVLYAVNSVGAAAASLAGGALTVTNSAGITSSSSPLCGTTSPQVATGSPITVNVSTNFKWFTPVGIFASSVNRVDASTTMRCE